MTTFEIKDEFYLNKKPFKIISGAIHYFRVVPEYWRDRLEKLKALGCNTVETYVPWNMHEPQEGMFDFEHRFNLRKFIEIAKELELFVILRPAPYICAEWEFGGLPYWLLKNPDLKIRFGQTIFLEKVDRYFKRLFEEVNDLQLTKGGPIILMQVENEYGGYANDKQYMKEIASLMRKHGVDVPLVTSDGLGSDKLLNGAIPEIALPTINCGSKVKEHFQTLRKFHGEKRPLMVMEFWVGWFDAWGDDYHHTTDPDISANELDQILSEGSVNIYMFHGGTNFGFTSGANYYEKLAPDVTSYDYDALLTEWGDITPKYIKFQEVINKYKDIPKVELTTKIERYSYGKVSVSERTSLLANLDNLSEKVQHNFPLTMEDLNQGTGYIYYRSNIGKAREIDDFRLISCMDRAQVFVNNRHLFTQYDKEIGEKKRFTLTEEENQLGILVENMGRVNYSVKMNHQQKGIRDGVIINDAFQSDWDMYTLPMTNLNQVNYKKEWQENLPSFNRFDLEVGEVGDTFLDLSGWGKGFVTVNGFNIGRFWEIGPQKRLYIPGPLLKAGRNEIVVFESEGKIVDYISFIDKPSI